jgi:type I restriction enzyme R subunit
MPGLHSERTLHKEILNELAAHGWLLGEGSKKAGKYDLKRALYTEDVISWLSSDRPDDYARVEAMHNGGTESKILDRLVKVLEQRGTIDVLRNGFSNVSAKFDMCAFSPNTGMNQTEMKRARRVILRVVPELQYSESNENRLDLAFFVNGIPVATSELKTDNTQRIDDAVRQYRYDRPVKDPVTKKIEPLLTWKRGALVHFAVSSSVVMMTTKLAGGKTHFLPFNRGNRGGEGNPPDEGINYLWEQILDRDAWLEILKSFVCIEKRKALVNGRPEIKETLLFPRFHQWDCVTKLIGTAREEGPGNRYLIQHSAGSGKSNSIMWLAHRLAHLYNVDDKKVFDTVFVLTDRTVLDDQLAETVQQFDHQKGTVARIDDKGDPKSVQLAKALEERAPIVIVTLQTFPFVADALGGAPSWQGRTFAIIADEAHSSQSGQSAKKIREILGMEDAEGDIGGDDALAAEMAIRSEHKNISYFGFTATPKKKTLELFGRKDTEGIPQAFHVYSMRQAIEEGFILDVLQNYLTYEMAYRVAKDGKDYDVPKSEAAKLIARMAKLHSYTISQKVAIIIEHFRETVRPLLDGHAKAMVVTDSREGAVRYKKQMDKYITEKGYSDLHTLVAFSGEVKIDTDFPGSFTEAGMNHLKGQSIPTALDTDDYQVLIVAEKFQTGFDQPLLCGMYVDKKLDGVAAVQTLSRLNRTYHGPFGEKNATYILDFVNDEDRIEKSFAPYFETAQILSITDPNIIHDLINTIDTYGSPQLYQESDIDAFARAYYEEAKSKEQRQTRLNNLIGPPRDCFFERRNKAREENESQAVEEAIIFRKNLLQFGKYYRFLSQIYNFGEASIAKRELFYDWLARSIREKETGEKVDITGVDLTHLKLTKTFEDKIKLGGAVSFIDGGDAVGSAVARIKAYSPLSAVIELMNEFFGSDISEENQISMIAGIFGKAIEDPVLVAQAKNNTPRKFALGDATGRIKNWMIETHFEETERNEANSNQMDQIKSILSEDEKFEKFASAMISAIYKSVRAEALTPPLDSTGAAVNAVGPYRVETEGH